MKAATPTPCLPSALPEVSTPEHQPDVPVLKQIFDAWQPKTAAAWKATTEETLSHASSLANVLARFTWYTTDAQEPGVLFDIHQSLELLNLGFQEHLPENGMCRKFSARMV